MQGRDWRPGRSGWCILSIGLVFAKGAGLGDVELLAPAIYVMAALTAFTVVQRVWHVRGELKALEASPSCNQTVNRG